MAFQYFHHQNDFKRHPKHRSMTVCIDMPEKSQFENLIGPHIKDIIELNIGYTIVHPNDNYSKKTGRESSRSKIQKTNFIISNIKYNTLDETELYLVSDKEGVGVQYIYVLLKKNTSRPYLRFAFVKYK